MEQGGDPESEFRWYWYHLVWALEALENPEARKYYGDSRKAAALFNDALARLERAMGKILLAELLHEHRRNVAARHWSALRERLDSLEHPEYEGAPRATAFPSDAITGIEVQRAAIQRELTLLEEELGPKELSRIQRAKPLPLCGTAKLRALQWTAEKQHEEDSQLLREVEGLLVGKDRHRPC